MNRKILAAAAVAAMAFAACPATAQTVDPARPQSLVTALQNAGYKAVLEKDDEGDPKIKSAASGANFSIYFYGCTNNVNCRSIQFSSGFTVKAKPDHARMNEWNSKNRFGQAYLDKENDPWLQFDVVMDGGIPPALFEATLDRWSAAIGSFQKFIGW